jgi:hypothetical protein
MLIANVLRMNISGVACLAGVTVAAFGASGLRALVIWRTLLLAPTSQLRVSCCISKNQAGTSFA